MSFEQKKIDGKIFTAMRTFPTKTEAKNIAKQLRKEEYHGYNQLVRVVKTRLGWTVYVTTGRNIRYGIVRKASAPGKAIEYAAQLVSTRTGEETWVKVVARGRGAADKTIVEKYGRQGQDYHHHITTKSKFLSHTWYNRVHSPIITHIEYELVWKTAPNSRVSKEDWANNKWREWRNLPTWFRKVVAEAMWDSLKKVT